MIIREVLLKIKSVLLSPPAELLVGAVVILVGTASFGLGRLSVLEAPTGPVRIVYPETKSQLGGASAAAEGGVAGGRVVGSKNGTKYHHPWCPGGKSISEANRVWFNSVEEAEKAGYTLAANCK